MKKQIFGLGENAFFVIPHVYVLMKLAQPARRPCNRPGFQHVICIDEFGTTCQTTLQRTFTCIEQLTIQRQAFIQVNDVEAKETDRTSSGHLLIDFFLTATVRVLPGTFGDLDCPGWSASTTWTHIALLTGASLNAHGLCVSRPCEQEGILSKSSKTGPTFEFTWTLTHAPPHPHPTPPHPCLHAHNGTHRDESTYLASSHER